MATGDYSTSFYLGGAVMLFSGVMMVIPAMNHPPKCATCCAKGCTTHKLPTEDVKI